MHAGTYVRVIYAASNYARKHGFKHSTTALLGCGDKVLVTVVFPKFQQLIIAST